MQNQLNHYYWANRCWMVFIYDNTWEEDYQPRLINHIVKGERAWLQRIEVGPGPVAGGNRNKMGRVE